MLKSSLFSAAFSFFVAVSAFAQLFTGEGQPAVMDDVLRLVKPGSVVIITENHGNEPHHQNQRDLLVHLSGASFPLSVGMEFLNYTDQPVIDSFLKGDIGEWEFLDSVRWVGPEFKHYRFQVLFPSFRGGHTIGLNLPRAVTGKVSQGGLEALSPDERQMLPPTLTLGNAEYFERFYEVMKHHVKDPREMDNYFLAQSLWDETMAWRAREFLQAHPDHLLTIIVGDFHAAYEDGLVERLRAQGLHTVVISQVVDAAEVAPHPKYGRRGDFVWLTP